MTHLSLLTHATYPQIQHPTSSKCFSSSLSQYAFLQSFPTQRSRSLSATLHPASSRKKPRSPSQFSHSFLCSSFSISFYPYFLPAPTNARSFLYLHFLGQLSHREESLALLLSAIAVGISVQFCLSYLSYLTSSPRNYSSSSLINKSDKQKHKHVLLLPLKTHILHYFAMQHNLHITCFRLSFLWVGFLTSTLLFEMSFSGYQFCLLLPPFHASCFD